MGKRRKAKQEGKEMIRCNMCGSDMAIVIDSSINTAGTPFTRNEVIGYRCINCGYSIGRDGLPNPGVWKPEKEKLVVAVAVLDNAVLDPNKGLPDEIFYYISRTTPLINVDLLIKDEKGRILLAWRDDPFSGIGWHLPGGIVRYKETLEERVYKVAEGELGLHIDFEMVPLEVNQHIDPERRDRGHFIAVLYKGVASSAFIPQNFDLAEKDTGYVKWFEKCPDNLIKCHDIYRKFM